MNEMKRVLPAHESDTKQELFDKYKDIIDTIHIYGPSILVAVYRRPKKTKGGILIPDSNLDEDIYQGKVGLILKVGPFPIDEEDKMFFDCETPKVGDWVAFKVSEALTFGILEKEGDCRFLKDRRSILMKIPHPDLIW